MAAEKILVVDDDVNLLELIKMRLESAGYTVTSSCSEEDALEAIGKEAFDLAIIDLRLNQKNGISLMETLRSLNPVMAAIILTAHGSIESAVEAMKKGAFTYLTKPFDPQELLLQIERASENRKLTHEIRRLEGLLKDKYDFANIVARSEKMQEVLARVAIIAKTESTVYIHGESGTGKELIARAIHLASDRKDKPFITINCAAIPESLLESELFGHEKGAFTGAVRNSRGLFLQANEGTIFLDEIGDMPLLTQAKLLRVLQERQFHAVGGEKAVKVDVRVIVATNKDLEAEVKKGAFREDLFYRIHVIPVELIPLRERKEDIPLLANHFLEKFNSKMKKEVNGFTPLAIQKLMLHDWPGNVRELENAIEYAVALTSQNVIGEDIILPSRKLNAEPLKSIKEAREEFERDYLIRLLEYTGGNVSKAAELSGKFRAAFYTLIKKYHIKPENYKNPHRKA